MGRHSIATTDTAGTNGSSSWDWNSRKEFFQFTRGRFVGDEACQMACRRVDFDMNELAKIAANSIGGKTCTAIEKCPDGLYNKAFIFTVDGERQVIGKIPNPNAGRPHHVTASEVATLDFVRSVLKVLAPKVYAWSSKKDNTPVGAEFIIMEKIPGVPLAQKWSRLQPAEKMNLLIQLSNIQQSWVDTKFSTLGSLYYRDDFPQGTTPLEYRNHAGEQITDPKYVIGSTTGRDWNDEGRQHLDCDRGPWTSVIDYKIAVGNREVAAIKTCSNLPKPDVMIAAPSLYIPTKEKKLLALEVYHKLLSTILPPSADQEFRFGYIWHNDLHDENIFVDPDDPTKITGIIDWQSTQITPLYDNHLDPSILEYSGPEPDPDKLEKPKLPENFESLSGEERTAIFKAIADESLLVAWRRLVKKKRPIQHKATIYANTVQGHLISLARQLFSVGEAHFLALLLDTKDEWPSLQDVQENIPPFPFNFSEEQATQMKNDAELAAKGIELMSQLKEQMGDLWPEKGLVPQERYDEVKAILKGAKESLKDELGLSKEERVKVDELWPFDD